jgi:putative ABC transport system permease protein
MVQAFLFREAKTITCLTIGVGEWPLRYAFRMLCKNWTFSLVAVLSLALGMGANASMFSLVNRLLMRPLAIVHPDEVLTIAPKTANPWDNISYPDYVDFRDRSQTMKDLVASMLYRFSFSPAPDVSPKITYGLLVSGNLFRAMGVTPVLGRGFNPEEDQVPGRDAVVVLGHDFWRDQFGEDLQIIGRRVLINGLEFTVIGVAPETFAGMDEFFKASIFVPAMMAQRFAPDSQANLLVNRGLRAFWLRGRLKEGVRVEEAQAELAGIAKTLEETYPSTNRGQSVTLRTELQMHVQHLPQESQFMVLAMVMAILVLLISCFNVANLLLSRKRSREIALRLAIGAGRLRLVCQLLYESVLLGIAGVITGLFFGWVVGKLFDRIRIPSDLPFLIDFGSDHRTVAYTLAIGFISVLFFGLSPALQSSKVNLVSALKATDDAGSGPRRGWGRNILVVAQIAVSVVLLVLATILYHGFSSQFSAGAGFRTNHILTMSLDPGLIRYDVEHAKEFYRRLVEQASTVHGVKSVSLSATLPLALNQRGFSLEVQREGYVYSAGERKDQVLNNIVDESFFETMDIPIILGRGFQTFDKETAPQVAVVNEVLAKKYWPDESPIGKRLYVDYDGGRWVLVVGVARTNKYVWMTEGPTEYLYLPMAQTARRGRILIVQSDGDPASLTGKLRDVISRLDANMPVYDVRTMEDYFSGFIEGTSDNILVIVGSMGITGLILAMIGLYGLVSYSVSLRTKEFGIRMAIGSSSSSVLGMVLREGIILCLAGIVIGLVISFSASRLLRSLVFTASTDWVPYAVVPTILFMVTVLATYGPAKRAATIDPMKALRDE